MTRRERRRQGSASPGHCTHTFERAELALQRPEQLFVLLFGSIRACLRTACRAARVTTMRARQQHAAARGTLKSNVDARRRPRVRARAVVCVGLRVCVCACSRTGKARLYLVRGALGRAAVHGRPPARMRLVSALVWRSSALPLVSSCPGQCFLPRRPQSAASRSPTVTGPRTTLQTLSPCAGVRVTPVVPPTTSAGPCPTPGRPPRCAVRLPPPPAYAAPRLSHAPAPRACVRAHAAQHGSHTRCCARRSAFRCG